ncbi:glycerol-3-phosphate dehydrogenase/oxidase [Timonella senegalensis]|uniref:glycerol-3-phosphate dehydrogenase/oxidase n=1 Tax=Timonella senegalensis TaxID=1465825 RepID=UPI0028ACD493|nr:glycerol-3-phosphate dehydrogenase/oxidase [Timonella senegalensis]
MSATSPNSTLSPESRSRSLEAMKATTPEAPLDVLVIGGGVTGAGIVLDAVTRGLDTAIVEAQDWASGTSSRSSKLVHGGLRYLQMLDFSLVHEALTERDLLLNKLAPHLVKPVPFLFPLIKQYERPYIGAGIMLYDILASLAPGKRAMPFHRHYSRKGMQKKFPSLRHDAAVGAIEYWDGSVDDARLVLTLVRTAASYGAHAAPRTQVKELTKSPAGRVNGAVLKDLETGETFTVHARHVINSTGVWTEETEALAGGTGGLKVLASKGIHIVVPRDRIKGTSGLILQTEKSVLFVIPWSRYWIIGTTDTPWKQELQHPVATSADIDYVIEHANAVLADPISREDIVGTFAGLRPLLQPEVKEGTSSAKVSREHTVASPTPGFTVIAGGKLTTYRVMAEDAVDFALGAEAASKPSVTTNIPLLGAVGLAAMKNQTRAYQQKFGWSKQMVEHLLHRYGSMINEIVAICNDDPTMAKPVKGAEAYLRAEIHYAVTREGVIHLEDVLLHRTRINYEFADRGLSALEEIADIAANTLGWDAETRSVELKNYRDRAAAEEAAAAEQDDASAEQVRLQASDLSPME